MQAKRVQTALTSLALLREVLVTSDNGVLLAVY
jgi:hypothetical protein